MSHFTVLVIGADHAAALQPFHEFECTGTSDQYVQDLDITAETIEEFKGATRSMLRMPDGSVISKYDDACYRELTAEEARKLGPFAGSGWSGPAGISYSSKDWGDGRGYRAKALFVPEGAEALDVPFESFTGWYADYHGGKVISANESPDLEDAHKFGYAVIDADGNPVKVINRTNPNKKWDWWTVGGRWPNKLLFKDGSHGSTSLVGELDLDGMLAEQQRKAGSVFDAVTAAIAGREVHSWASVLKRRDAGEFTFESAREFYNSQQVVKDLVEREVIDRWDGASELSGVLAAKDRAQYVERESQVNSSTWALLHDGNWSERGSMGWWGMSDATDGSTLDYAANYWLTLRSLPDSERVTVVDCHI